MPVDSEDPRLILATWPVLTTASIALTLVVAVFAKGMGWDQLTPSEYDSFLIMPALLAPVLTWKWGRRTGGESDIIRYAFCIGLGVLVIIGLRLAGEEITFGFTVFGILPYAGTLIALCLVILHMPLPLTPADEEE